MLGTWLLRAFEEHARRNGNQSLDTLPVENTFPRLQIVDLLDLPVRLKVHEQLVDRRRWEIRPAMRLQLFLGSGPSSERFCATLSLPEKANHVDGML